MARERIRLDCLEKSCDATMFKSTHLFIKKDALHSLQSNDGKDLQWRITEDTSQYTTGWLYAHAGHYMKARARDGWDLKLEVTGMLVNKKEMLGSELFSIKSMATMMLE